jgi:hypothetical protein
MRHGFAITAAGLLLLLASAAQAAPPEARVAGAYCTPAGCVGGEGSSPLGMAGGFALASVAMVLRARRSSPRGA